MNRHPLVCNCTNSVAMNFCANVLLAAGACPLMFEERKEAGQIVSRSDALCINIGTLDSKQRRTMLKAAKTARKKGIPWVLDPAGVGMSTLRARTVCTLIRRFRPSVIKGNASEIAFLSQYESRRWGQGERRHSALTADGCGTAERECCCPAEGLLESEISSGKAIGAAKRLSRRSGAVVVVSGQTDYVVEGDRVLPIEGGSPLMAKVTAMGCAASGLCAAFLAGLKPVGSEPALQTHEARQFAPEPGSHFESAASAMSLMAKAGQAAEAIAAGPGSFCAAFIDALHTLSQSDEKL